MSPADSVTHWLALLRAGDHAAAQPLWEAYCRRLAALASHHLRGAPRRAADEEDVALSAFASFCRGVKEGRFPQLRDSDDLWSLLAVITARKAWRLLENEGRQKRGGGKVIAEADLRGSDAEARGLAQVLGREPSPAFAAQVADECRRLLDRLGDPELRSIALWRMEGYSVEEIARGLGCRARTVQRRLCVIRTLWEQEQKA
jgi:DNA-directed RNA polymerase specialized sigma24 family protein